MRGRTPLAVRRATADPPLPLATFASLLLAATTPVARTADTTSATDSGVRRVVAAASEHDTDARVTAPTSRSGPAAAGLTQQAEWGRTGMERAAFGRRLLDDPLAAALRGALILGFAAALPFAARPSRAAATPPRLHEHLRYAAPGSPGAGA